MSEFTKTGCGIRRFGAAVLLLIFGIAFTGTAFADDTGYIELSGGTEMDWPCGRPFTDPGWEARDAQGNSCSDSVEIEGEPCVWKTGTYTLVYSFTDSDGRLVEARRTVNIVPVELPEEAERENVIYLSFDDGPCEYTDRVLELLEKYNAKATFFVIGSSPEEYHDRIGKIHSLGHQVGIHAHNHEYSKLYSSEEYFFEDFMRMQSFVHEHTGSYATVCRFPGGSETAYQFLGRRTEGGFDVIKQRLADMGVRYYDWNVKIEGEGRTGNDLYYSFIMQVPQSSTPICLQHDTRLYSVNTLERLLQWGTENGYTFAAIDTSTPQICSR